MNCELKAIVWDYDGTIADTAQKNYNVSSKIISKVFNGKIADFKPLKSPEELYIANQRSGNWRELYRNEFGIPDNMIDRIGSMWTEFQMDDDTEIKIYEGITGVLEKHNDIQHAIVSQNSQASILRFLNDKNISAFFKAVYGYEQVDIKNQKPHPEGLLNCIENDLSISDGCVLYIGDQTSDFLVVKNANKQLDTENVNLKLLSVGIRHWKGVDKYWHIKPDYLIDNFDALSGIITDLTNTN